MTDVSRQDAEWAVLGGLLMDPGMIRVYAARLHPNLFYWKKSKDICNALLAILHGGDIPEDILPAVSGWLEEKADWGLEDRMKLSAIMDASVTSASIEYYLAIIEDKAMRRAAIQSARVLIATAEDQKTDAEAVIAATQGVHDAVMASQSSGEASVGELFDSIGTYFEDIITSGISGVTSGYPRLDRTLGGFSNGVYLLAGRPGNGKTTFSINMALRQARSGLNVGFISLEAGEKDLLGKLLSHEMRGSAKNPPPGISSESWTQKMREAKQRLQGVTLFIEANTGRSVDSVIKAAHSMMARRKLHIIYIDYAQLMTAGNGHGRVEELDQISKKIVGLNRDLGIPIVAMAQLNRQIGQREIHRPVLTDIKGCGSFEEDATGVLFTCDPRQWGEAGSLHEITIAKHREGPIAMNEDFIPFVWEKSVCRFEEGIKDDDEPPF